MSKNPEKMEHFERLVLDRAFEMPELAGRWPLRRKALGLASLASCYLYYMSGRGLVALGRLLRSFAWWPVPYRKPAVHVSLVRVRLLLAILRGLATGAQGRPQ
jgi:hypothetical protein